MANGKALPKQKDLPKKERTKTTTQLKKDLDKVFSQYIRLKYANKDGNVNCYICGILLHWKKIHNGHLVSRYYLATRYDERNCRPCCYVCNVIRNGRIPEFSEKLNKEYGSDMTSNLYRLANTIIKDFPYITMIEEYKQKINLLNETT